MTTPAAASVLPLLLLAPVTAAAVLPLLLVLLLAPGTAAAKDGCCPCTTASQWLPRHTTVTYGEKWFIMPYVGATSLLGMWANPPACVFHPSGIATVPAKVPALLLP